MLAHMNLECYAAIFAKEQITGSLLLLLDDAMLESKVHACKHRYVEACLQLYLSRPEDQQPLASLAHHQSHREKQVEHYCAIAR